MENTEDIRFVKTFDEYVVESEMNYWGDEEEMNEGLFSSDAKSGAQVLSNYPSYLGGLVQWLKENQDKIAKDKATKLGEGVKTLCDALKVDPAKIADSKSPDFRTLNRKTPEQKKIIQGLYDKKAPKDDPMTMVFKAIYLATDKKTKGRGVSGNTTGGRATVSVGFNKANLTEFVDEITK